MRYKKLLFSRDYSIFALITILVSILSISVLVFVLNQDRLENQNRSLKKQSKNISAIIFESFSHTNRINSHLGKQIAENGADDLNFILELFQKADKIQHKDKGLFSWTSFDWVNSKNHQTVNSRIGVRKNPPNMSHRQFSYKSPKNPWTLQVSYPVLGNPSKMWVIPAGTGITDKNGKYLGSIVVGFNIVEFTSKVESRINKNVSFIVLDEDLNIIMQSRDNVLARNDSFFKNNVDIAKFNKNLGVLDQSIISGDIHYSYYEKIKNHPYIIITGFNKAFLDQEFNSLILPYILQIVGMTIFFLIILYLFKVRITNLLVVERRLRQALYRTNQTKTKLIRAATHDLKNYVFGISGLAKLILDKKSKAQIKNNEDLEFTQTIYNQSEELMYFVEDLLDTNQSDNSELSLGRIGHANVKEIISRMILLNNNFSIKNKVSVYIDVEDNIPEIKCDVRRLKQIFSNLIINAIKYSKEGGIVNVQAKYLKKEGLIYVQVSDQGIGMDKKEVEMALSGFGEKIDKSYFSEDLV